MKEPKLIYVEWFDAYSDDNWQSITDAIIHNHKLMLVKTVGYIVSKNKKRIVISHTTAFNRDHTNRIVCGCLHIPMRSIIKIKEVKI